MRRAVRLIALLLAALPGAAGHAAVSAVDYLGNTVTLEKPARRIVALAPHIVENVFSAGAGDRLVGVVAHSDYPAQAAGIPVIGDYQAWSIEAIVALQPDLILAWGSGNRSHAVKSIARLGAPVFVSEPRRLEDIPRNIRAIGTLAGTGDSADAEAQRIERGLSELREKYRSQRRLQVFYQVWHTPLQTLNGDHLVSRVLSLCGADNAFADAPSLAPVISIESVLQRDPDAIVAGGMGEARPEWLDDWRRYPSLRAVRRGALYFVHPDQLQRPTARILLGARALCRQLDAGRKLLDHGTPPGVTGR